MTDVSEEKVTVLPTNLAQQIVGYTPHGLAYRRMLRKIIDKYNLAVPSDYYEKDSLAVDNMYNICRIGKPTVLEIYTEHKKVPVTSILLKGNESYIASLYLGRTLNPDENGEYNKVFSLTGTKGWYTRPDILNKLGMGNTDVQYLKDLYRKYDGLANNLRVKEVSVEGVDDSPWKGYYVVDNPDLAYEDGFEGIVVGYVVDGELLVDVILMKKSDATDTYEYVTSLLDSSDYRHIGFFTSDSPTTKKISLSISLGLKLTYAYNKKIIMESHYRGNKAGYFYCYTKPYDFMLYWSALCTGSADLAAAKLSKNQPYIETRVYETGLGPEAFADFH